MRVAYYARVNPEAHERLLGQQAKLLDEIARRPDWELIGAYADVGAGTTLDHPALSDLRRSARRRRFDLVLVTNLHHFARSVGLAETVLAELAECGVAVQVLGEPTPLPADRAAVHLGAPATKPAGAARTRRWSRTVRRRTHR